MDDFTKTKLINNLIDLVEHFYDLKQQQGSAKKVHYLKGFSEGIAFTLVESKVLNSKEAKTILKGLGKKRELKTPPKAPLKTENLFEVPTPKEVTNSSLKEAVPQDSLDIPTIFRKHSNLSQDQS